MTSHTGPLTVREPPRQDALPAPDRAAQKPVLRPRPLFAMGIYALVVMIGGASLAPWLYRLAQTLAPGSPLALHPFHRFMDRSLMGVALLGLWPFLRSVEIKSWRDIGLARPRAEWRRLAGGFLLGFGSLAGALAVVLLVHARRVSTHVLSGEVSAAQIAIRIVTALAAGIAVGCLEEILFRGVVYSALRKSWDWRIALFLSSGIFAFVHFLKFSDPATVTWSSGLEMLPGLPSGPAFWDQLAPGFINVALIGVLLGLAFQATGSLCLSIGLHAGWVFSLKLYGFLTAANTGANVRLWGTEKFTDGWLASAVLIFALLALVRLPVVRARATSP